MTQPYFSTLWRGLLKFCKHVRQLLLTLSRNRVYASTSPSTPHSFANVIHSFALTISIKHAKRHLTFSPSSALNSIADGWSLFILKTAMSRTHSSFPPPSSPVSHSQAGKMDCGAQSLFPLDTMTTHWYQPRTWMTPHSSENVNPELQEPHVQAHHLGSEKDASHLRLVVCKSFVWEFHSKLSRSCTWYERKWDGPILVANWARKWVVEQLNLWGALRRIWLRVIALPPSSRSSIWKALLRTEKIYWYLAWDMYTVFQESVVFLLCISKPPIHPLLFQLRYDNVVENASKCCCNSLQVL